MNKRTICLVLTLACALTMLAQHYNIVKNIAYTMKTDTYSAQRLKLDIYYQEQATDLPVVVWFHGGGLTSGEKDFPYKLKEKNCVLVAVNYRLLPNVTIDQTIDDAAEAVAWVMNHITEYGGSTKKIIVSGHSAGGYLTMMLALNRECR